MNELEHLLDDDDAPGFALLRAARDVPGPPEGALEQTLSGLGVGGTALAATAGAKAGTASWASVGKWLAAGVALGVAGSAGVTAVQEWQRPQATVQRTNSVALPSPAHSATTQPAHEQPPAPALSAAPAPAASSGRAARGVLPARDSKAPGLAAEIERLDQVHHALTRADARAALAALDTYDAEFRGGQLAPEAALLRVRALVAAGQAAAGRELAERLILVSPDPDYAARLREATNGGAP